MIRKKGYACKKNIVIGIIMTVILCIYGSFMFMPFAEITVQDVPTQNIISDATVKIINERSL